MRRTTLLIAMALLFAAPTAAVVQNGTSPSNQVGEGDMGITAAPDATRTSQTFGSSGGPQYDMTFTTVNTTGAVPGDKVTSVSTGNGSVTLTGRIEVPTPCHELSTSVEETDELIVTVNATAGDGACVQQVATKYYTVTVESGEPFRLEVRHATTGMEVRTVETPGYEPGSDRERRGVLAGLFQFLDGLF